MLSLQARPVNTELGFALMREDALTICYEDALSICSQVVEGKPLHAEIKIPVIPLQTHPLELDEHEWLSFLQGFDVSDSVSNSLEGAIVRHFAEIPEVAEVYFAREGDTLDVWTILSVSNRETRWKVYAKEAQIIQEIPRYVINFRVSSPAGASTPASAWYRKVNINRVRLDAKRQRSPIEGQTQF